MLQSLIYILVNSFNVNQKIISDQFTTNFYEKFNAILRNIQKSKKLAKIQ